MIRFFRSFASSPLGTLYRRASHILFVEAAGKAVVFASTFVAASILPADEFAVFGVMQAVLQFVAALAQGGLAEATLGKVATIGCPLEREVVYRAGIRGLGWTTAIAACAVAGWAVAFGPVQGPYSWGATAAIVAGGAATALVVLRASFHIAEGDVARACMLRGVLYSCASGTGVAMLMLLRTPESFYWGYALGCIPGVLLRSPVARPPTERTLGSLHVQLLRASAPFATTTILAWGASSGATLFVYHFFDARTTGCYTLMSSLAGLVIFATGAVNQGWQSEMLQVLRGAGDDPKKSHRRLASLMEVALFSTACALFVGVAVARDFGVWFPARYPEVEYILVLALAPVLGSLNYFCSVNHFIFFQAGLRLLQISALTYLIGFAGWIFAAWIFGAPAVYLGWGGVLLLRSVVVAGYAARQWDLEMDWWRAARLLAAFSCLVYLLQVEPHIQGLREIVR